MERSAWAAAGVALGAAPEPDEARRDTYRVKLEIFEGPLDLLLYLIRKDEIDIYDIPIARITEQYLAYLELMKELTSPSRAMNRTARSRTDRAAPPFATGFPFFMPVPGCGRSRRRPCGRRHHGRAWTRRAPVHVARTPLRQTDNACGTGSPTAD